MYAGVDTCSFLQKLLVHVVFRQVCHRSIATQFWLVRRQSMLTSCAG